MPTARELADQIRKARKPVWDRVNPTQAVVATQQLNPEDQEAVHRVVTAAGFTGQELEEMIRQVSSLLVGQVTALDDSQPAEGGD